MKHAISLDRRQAAVKDYLARKADLSTSTTIAEVASDHDMSPASLKRFLRAHRGGPIRAPLPNRGGPQPRLSATQRARLVELVLETPTMNLGMIGQVAEQEFGMTVSESTIRRCLRENGLSKRKLRKTSLAEGPAASADPDRRYKARHRRVPEPRPHRNAYPSDFTDQEWAFVQPKWEEVARRIPRDHSLRDVLEALRFIGATGIPWRFLPHDFPPHNTVRRWFDIWTRDGSIAAVNDWLRRRLRRRSGAKDTPSVLIIDSQSIKTTEGGDSVGYDGGKKIRGRKRHIAVDTHGLPWFVCIHGANIQDRDGAALLLPDDLKTQLPRLKVIFADGGYAGRCVKETEARTGVKLEIVRRSDSYGAWVSKDSETPWRKQGFQVLPKRWIVERSFGWATKRRRLSCDYERTVEASESWFRLAFQHTMVARAVT